MKAKVAQKVRQNHFNNTYVISKMSSLHYLTVGNTFRVMQDSCNPDNWIMHLHFKRCCAAHTGVRLLYCTDLKNIGRKTSCDWSLSRSLQIRFCFELIALPHENWLKSSETPCHRFETTGNECNCQETLLHLSDRNTSIWFWPQVLTNTLSCHKNGIRGLMGTAVFLNMRICSCLWSYLYDET